MNEFEALRATEIAIAEGRVDGQYRCSLCGMRSHTQEEAAECCAALISSMTERLPVARFHRAESRD